MVNNVLKTQLCSTIYAKSPSASHRFNSGFFHPDRTSAVGTSTLISDLNTYWRLELGSLNCDTIEARSALIDTSDFQQWLGLFNEFVLPVVVGAWDSAKKETANG